YIEHNPKIANIFDVYNINGSSGVRAKIAGILSTAKTKSVISITAKATNKGVTIFTPFCTVKNLSPSKFGDTLKNLCTKRTPKFLDKSWSSSSLEGIPDLIPATIKNIPKTNKITLS